jgi:hypothetical protein
MRLQISVRVPLKQRGASAKRLVSSQQTILVGLIYKIDYLPDGSV